MYYHEICRMEIGDFSGQVTEMLTHFIGGAQLSSTSGYDNCIARDQPADFHLHFQVKTSRGEA